MSKSKRDVIKSRVRTDDGSFLHGDEARKYIKKRRQKIIALTENEDQRDRIAKKEAMIRKYGEEKYNRLATEHGMDILED